MNTTNYEFPLTNISCPIESVTGVWEFKRPPYFKYLCYSLPGHLLHLITKGSYTVKISGQKYYVKAGDIIYYYETEEVETIGNKEDAAFLSVGFHAPNLQPLPLDMRVFPSNNITKSLFVDLHTAFSSQNLKTRNFKIFASLLNILDNIEGIYIDSQTSNKKENLWWALERRIRRTKMFRPTLDDLSKIGGFSRATIIRSCKKATGDTPIQRIRKIRMEEARFYLSSAQLNVSEVAEYLGYPRVHEFSREFSQYYGEPPSHLKNKAF